MQGNVAFVQIGMAAKPVVFFTLLFLIQFQVPKSLP